MKTKAFRIAGGVALLALGAPLPACAQFFSNYPVIIVPPPPAQNLVMPQKPAPKPAPAKPSASAPPPDTPNGPNATQCYQGRTKVCP
jgi:hypothetical protein